MRRTHLPTRRARGSALVFILLILVAGAAFLVSALRSNPQIERDKVTADALAQAKDALIGFAATYRDKNPNDVFGYLPLPDMGTSRATATEGSNAANFAGNTKNITVIGRLPWQELGLPALRDSRGECLWYAVSGSFQNIQKADVLNWDSLGHFDTYSSDGTAAGTVSTTGNNYHQRAVAIIFSAGEILPGQGRQTSTTDTVTTCGGNYDVRNYLDAYNADANISNIVNYFTGTTNNSTGYAYNLTSTSNGSLLDATALAAPKNIIFGSIETNLGMIVNDRILVITADDIFKRIKQRNDFKSDIDTLMNDLAAYLNTLTVASLPAASGSKGINNVVTDFLAANPALSTKKTNILDNWKENLLYAKLPTPTAVTIDGVPSSTSCAAVLIFGGERTTRTVSPLVAQTRALSTDKSDATMYLEGVNATSFPGGIAYSGASQYPITTPSADVIRCITGSGGGGGTTVTFSDPAQFSQFELAGSGVTVDTTDPENPVAHIDVAGGSSGGCFWFPDPQAINGKTLRAFYEFQFKEPDPPGAVDIGYGFTFSLLAEDMDKPTICSSQSRMGVLPASEYPFSLFVETDIHDGGGDETAANHTAIMANGNIVHSATNGNLTATCNGTAAGCNHSPSNKFEENPTPLWHNQRVEIHSGYNSTCTASGGTYSLVKVWVDCLACTDTAADFASSPTVRRCINLDSSMNKVYFGFTAGFSSAGGNVQGVAIKSLDLRVE